MPVIYTPRAFGCQVVSNPMEDGRQCPWHWPENLERVIEISILLADCWLFFPGDKNTALSFQKVYNLFDKKELRLRMLGQNNCNAFSKVKNYDLWVWYPLAVSEPLLKERQIVKYILPLTTDQSSFSQNNQESAKFISTTTLSTLNQQMTNAWARR